MNPALGVILAFVALAFGLGAWARRGRTMTLEQWSVGGRGFGTLFVFLLMAGEIYTTFTFLGASGWAYGKGAPAFYILCYGALAYTASYFLLPPIWRHATRHRLHSQADYFARRYASRPLGVLVALVGVVALLPYLILQLKGLGIIVSETSYGLLSPAAAIWGSTLVLVAYVMLSGVHGSAWTAVVKDVLILAVAVALGLYLPWRYYGGIGPMFETLAAARPGLLVLPAGGQSPAWFISTVLLSALGFYMWPHGFSSIYTARSEETFRRNAAVMPLYQLVLLFIFFTGFAAVLQVPGLKGADADLSLLRLSKLAFAPAVVGLIGAAGVLTALVPGSMLLLTGATLVAKNVYGALRPGTDEAALGRLARLVVPLFALAAVFGALHGGSGLVPLLLMGYNCVTQLFPALALSLAERPWPTAAGVMAGILVGEAVVLWLGLGGVTLAKLLPGWPAVVTDLNVGLVALLANGATLVAVTLLTRRGGRGGAAG